MEKQFGIFERKKYNISNSVIMKRLILLIIAIIMVHISYISPMQSDDFEFASYHFNNIIKAIKYSLYYGNGRLLGNIGACILNNNIVLRVIVKGIMIMALLLLIPRVLILENKFLEYVIYFLIIGIPPEMFAQVFVWTSGFQNYIPPIVLMLMCMCICKYYSGNKYQLCCIIFLAFISQLYVEHCTMIHIMVALLCVIYYAIEKNREKNICSRAWLISTMVGAVCMFLIPKIFFIENNRTKGYRSIHLKGSMDLINTIKSNTFTLLNTYSKGVILWIVFCILSILLVKIVEKNIVDRLTIWIYILYPIINTVAQITNWTGIWRHLCVLGGMCVCFILTMWNVFRLKNNKIKACLMINIIFSIASVVPMLIVTPFAERNVFLSYVFFVIFIILGLDYVMTELDIRVKKWLLRTIYLLAIIGMICLDIIFINIKQYADLRESHIIESMEQKDKTIYIFELPSRYMFPTYLIGQYYYYENRGDIKFIHMNYEEWKKKIYKPTT